MNLIDDFKLWGQRRGGHARKGPSTFDFTMASSTQRITCRNTRPQISPLLDFGQLRQREVVPEPKPCSLASQVLKVLNSQVLNVSTSLFSGKFRPGISLFSTTRQDPDFQYYCRHMFHFTVLYEPCTSI